MSAEEKQIRSVEVTSELEEEIKKYVRKAKAVTPQSLASKYGIRVSIAKKLLRTFEKEGLVVCVDGYSKLRIYKGAR